MKDNTMTHRRAVSALHKAIRRGDVEYASYCAAYLWRYKTGRYAAWRRVLAMPAEDLAGEGIERVVALYDGWRSGYEMTNLWAAILYLCRLVMKEPFPEREAGRLNREAVELCSAACYWIQRDRPNYRSVPDYALDYHSGQGTLDEWWQSENQLSEPSPWRDDAMALDWDRWKSETKNDEKNKDQAELPF